MLTEKQINILPERIYQRLNRINKEYLESIGTVLKEIGELRPKDVHQLQQMYNYGGDIDKLARGLAEASEKNIAEIYDIFDAVAKENYNYAKPFYEAAGKPHIPYKDNEQLKTYVRAMAKQTVGEYLNLTRNTAFAVFDKGGKSIAPLFEANKNTAATSLSDTYNKVVDYAVTKVQLGEESYSAAIREAVDAIAGSGIKTVDYATGYKRRLDTAAKQNILWGIKQCNQNTAEFVGEDFGADGYEISYHSNPRPSHAEMGGKQYAIGKARTVNGIYYPSFEDRAASLLEDYNCLHYKYPILLGISVPTYSKAQLEQYKANDRRNFEFEGKEYTGYEGAQLQRKIETAIRHQKDRAICAKAAGADDVRLDAQYKINQLTNKYAELSKASGLPTQSERMQVKGFRSVKTPENLLTEERKVDIIKHSGLAAKIGDKRTPMHEEPKLLKIIDYNDKKAVMDEIKAFEKIAVTKNIEMACVITKNGEVWKCFGIEDRVFPDYDLGDKLHGAYVSHNHPIEETAFSFSTADFNLFLDSELEMLCGVDKKYSYQLTRMVNEIDDMPLEWQTEENYWHAVTIEKAHEYKIGYRRWKRG